MTIDRHTPVDELPELLRVDEAAAWADVSPGLVREAIRRKQLHAVRLGRLMRVSRDSLAGLLGRNGNGNSSR